MLKAQSYPEGSRQASLEFRALFGLFLVYARLENLEKRALATADNIKLLIYAIKRAEVQFLAEKTINALTLAAINCCEAGGMWKGCLQPLVNKLHYWKVLGIPADPMWDD